MNTSLYALANEYQDAAIKLADLDMPEEAVIATLESLHYPVEQKAVNVGAFVRNLEALVDQIKTAETDMAKRRKAIEKRAEHVRSYLLANLQRCGISKVESPHFRIAVKDNPPAVVVDDENLIPDEFWRQPPTPSPVIDKIRIAPILKEGGSVPGCHLAAGVRLDIK